MSALRIIHLNSNCKNASSIYLIFLELKWMKPVNWQSSREEKNLKKSKPGRNTDSCYKTLAQNFGCTQRNSKSTRRTQSMNLSTDQN